MSIRYYFSWFDNGFPSNITKLLKNDITDRKSLVMISGNPEEEIFESDFFIKKWFDQVGILFNEYHIFNKNSSENEMKDILNNASLIFLCGGYPKVQNDFIIKNDLKNTLKYSDSIIMGASAGSMNMSLKWLSSKNTDQSVEYSSVVSGVGLDNFYFCTKANQSITDKKLIEELSQKLADTQIFIAIGESAIRIENENRDFTGEIFSMFNKKITNIESSL